MRRRAESASAGRRSVKVRDIGEHVGAAAHSRRQEYSFADPAQLSAAIWPSAVIDMDGLSLVSYEAGMRRARLHDNAASRRRPSAVRRR
jgi:hypothetical protein